MEWFQRQNKATRTVILIALGMLALCCIIICLSFSLLEFMAAVTSTPTPPIRDLF